MNILLIGNGFDLAHELPTKYGDFLSFIKIVKAVVIEDNYSPEFDSNFNSKLQEILEGDKENEWNDLLLYREEWKTLVENNVWIDYFLQYVWDKKENWIDFEKEISKVIQIIDNDISVGKYNLDRIVTKISNKFFDDYFIEDYWGKCDEIRTIKIGQIYNECGDWKNAEEIADKYFEENPIIAEKEEITYADLIFRLQMDLDKMIRALEIYLEMYVKKLPCANLQKDIGKLDVEYVLSFNYTDTYERLYNAKNVRYNYIHGKAELNNIIENNNMVLGIDDYLQSEMANNDTTFVAFKKYYQRIIKSTDNLYMSWLSDISYECQKAKERMHWDQNKQLDLAVYRELGALHNLYIFGHSLDVTDKDILREIILNDNVYKTIYNNSKDGIEKKELGNKVANLIKIIGKENTIKLTSGETKRIEFKMQEN